MKKLTAAQTELLSQIEAQAKAAAEYPGTYSRGLAPGTVGCHKTVAASLVKMGLLVTKRSALHGQIVDLPS